MPFSSYKDFDDCVRKNSDKDDPKAYCGKIKAAVEGENMKQDFQVRTTITNRVEISAFEETDGKMTAKVRILKAGKSKNRRNYPPHIVKEAVDKKLFDGIRMFINHDRKNPDPNSRSFHDMVSAVESTTFDAQENAMDGVIRFFDRSFYEKAQEARDYMGVSINALVRGTRQVIAGQVHEDVQGWSQPRSVDWVIFPAAGGAIMAFEDEDAETMIDWTKVTAEELKKNNLEVYEAILAEAEGKTDEKDEPPEPKKNEKTDSKEMVAKEDVGKLVADAIAEERKKDDSKTKKRETASAAVREAFRKSGLPERTSARVMNSFEGVEEFDEKAVTAAIEDAKEELKAVGAGPHIRDMGPTGGGGDKSAAESFSVHESVKEQFGIKKAEKETEKKEVTK